MEQQDTLPLFPCRLPVRPSREGRTGKGEVGGAGPSAGRILAAGKLQAAGLAELSGSYADQATTARQGSRFTILFAWSPLWHDANDGMCRITPSMLDLFPIRIDDIAPSTPMGRALLDLNNADHLQLSWLDPERLSRLVQHAFVATRAGAAQALLLAFDQSADYDSPNFLWFRGRLNRFVYVDRVVVAANARGLGVARRLYGSLFDAAIHAGHDKIVCEVNSHPPNPRSDAFHASLGFTEIGTGVSHGGKTVRYLACTLPRGTTASRISHDMREAGS